MLRESIEELKKKHESELKEYVQQQDIRYRELLKQKLDVEDANMQKEDQIKKLKEELARLQAKYQADLNTCKDSNDKLVQEMKLMYEKKIDNLERKTMELETQIQKSSQEVVKLQSQITFKNNDIIYKDKTIAELNKMLEEKGGLSVNQNQQIADL